MGRPRSGVCWPEGDDAESSPVWVKQRGEHFVVVVRDPNGRVSQRRTSSLDDAVVLAEKLVGALTLPRAHQPFASLVEHFLVDYAPVDQAGHLAWSLSHLENMRGWSRRWLGPYLKTACFSLPDDIRDQVAVALRHRSASGRPAAVSTENKVDDYLVRLLRHGAAHGFIDPQRHFPLKVRNRVTRGERRTAGEVSRVWRRNELPSIRQVFVFARLASKRSGVWWDQLRWLLLFFCGPRLGELHALVLTDVILHPDGPVELSITKKAAWLGTGDRIDPHTKNWKEREIQVPPFLWQPLRRRADELRALEASGFSRPLLLFPAVHPSRGRRPSMVFEGYVADKDRLKHQWLGVGRAAGFPVRTFAPTTKHLTDGTPRTSPRPSSLRWRIHDARHFAATWMLAPTVRGKRIAGRGMGYMEVAYVLGDAEQTIRRNYEERSAAHRQAARDRLWW